MTSSERAGAGLGEVGLLEGAAQERTDPRPQLHQALRRGRLCFPLLGFQLAKQGLGPG